MIGALVGVILLCVVLLTVVAACYWYAVGEADVRARGELLKLSEHFPPDVREIVESWIINDWDAFEAAQRRFYSEGG